MPNPDPDLVLDPDTPTDLTRFNLITLDEAATRLTRQQDRDRLLATHLYIVPPSDPDPTKKLDYGTP